ncbi:MAG: hypothetical protein HY720_01520 [Planctomycetes bacterium]|nr:hypothetical protein [Planctomycetota bacterium]
MNSPLSRICRWVATLSFLALLALPAAAQGGGGKSAEDAIKDFRSRIGRGGATQADVTAGLKSLDQAHPAVLKELLRWAALPFVPPERQSVTGAGFTQVGGEDDRPNCVAATRIGELFHGDPEAARGLVRVIKARAEERIRPGTIPDLYRVHDLGWLLDVYAVVHRPEGIAELLPLSLHEDSSICERVLALMGEHGDESLVEPLIRVLAHAEKRNAGPAGAAGAGLSFGDDTGEIVVECAAEALQSITGEELRGSAEWVRWWRENGKTFKRAAR